MIPFKSSEHKLWWMIIHQTLFDLEMSVYKAESPIKSNYTLYEQCTLREVINDIHSPWMMHICELAGLNYFKFLKVIEKIVHKEIRISDFREKKSYD